MPRADAVAPPPPLAWLHRDDALLAIDKPAGLLAVPGRGPDKQDCAWTRVAAVDTQALVVHRLDQATSGLLLFARGIEMQRRLSAAFAERRVHKEYEAVVAGRPGGDHGTVDLPLAADWPHRPRQQVDLAVGKPALTHWRWLSPGPLPGTSRLALQPVTGRSHQLRVHLAAIGHPIVGDALYARPDWAGAAPRLLLHARAVALVHPVTGEAVRLDCPVPF